MIARPILFSGPMIRALLDGKKTQTRRTVNPQPFATVNQNCVTGEWAQIWYTEDHRRDPTVEHIKPLKCPYGKPGDLLWVRESIVQSTWSSGPDQQGEYQEGWGSGAKYKADGAKPGRDNYGNNFSSRPSIHMPRWASRLTLEITGVRVERLKDICETDAIAEGCYFTDYGRRCFHQGQGDITTCPGKPEHHPQREGWMWAPTRSSDECLGSARNAYGNLWESINGPGSWDANPWVWCLSFKVHRCNVDELMKARAA